VHSEWKNITRHFSNMKLGEFIIMPNHVHGIIIIDSESTVGATRPTIDEIMESISGINPIEDGCDRWARNVGATRPPVSESVEFNGSKINQTIKYRDGSPLRVDIRPNGPKPGSLGAIIGQFKSRATKRIWAMPEIERHPIWQRNYYEHIIRDEQEYQRMIQYIEINPIKWSEDEYYSEI
jgi:putative transposase